MIIRNVMCTERDLEREKLEEEQYEKRTSSIMIGVSITILALAFLAPILLTVYFMLN
jgi:hypothetical protein